jgi:hypothetical protein
MLIDHVIAVENGIAIIVGQLFVVVVLLGIVVAKLVEK